MTRRIPVVVLVLVLLGAVPATAQNAALKGVTAFRVVITEDLNDDSASCGITETGLTTAASKALLDNGIRVDASRSLLVIGLYVYANTLYFADDNLCVSSVLVELRDYLDANPRHSAQPVFGQFILTRSFGMASSGRANHGQDIRDDVFRRVETIAVDIRLANQ